MTTQNLIDEKKAEALEAALRELREAAEALQPYYADPRIRVCLAQLEGLAGGWFYSDKEMPDRLADLLADLLSEAHGEPVADHWRGPLTVEEAGGWLG